MRGVLEAVGVRASGRAGIWRAASARRLLLLAALVSLGLGLAVRQLAAPGAATTPAASATHVSGAAATALPIALRGPLSAAIGAADRSYRVATAAGGGLTALTPAQHLRSSFGASGVTVASAGQRLSLGLRAIGLGAARTPVAPVAPRGRANRVVLAHQGLSEWYLNGPLGLEQGFTISHAPAGHGGPLTLALGLSSSAPARLSPNHKGFTVGAPGAGSIAYTGLTAVDALGRLLPSRLQISGGQLLISVDATGASYPVKVDPFVEQASLTGTGESGNGRLGASVALSADGNTALVGAWRDNGEVGAAWVFTRSGETWAQQGSKLTGSGEVGAGHFGQAVALSDDGDTALIGGYGDSSNAGAAWVFTRSGETWAQQGSKLTGSGEAGAGRFGISVALSDDGNTALIGGNRDNSNTGAAWAFTRSGETWTQQGSKLTGTGEAKEGTFGSSVALSGDGNTALIGARTDNEAGAVFAFVREEATWSQQGPKLTGTGGTELDEFGASVALSDDGNTALVGAPGETIKVGAENVEIGGVWPFKRAGGTWTPQGSKLTGSEEVGSGRFGESVALSGSGTVALIGGVGDSAESGAAWVFGRSGETWLQQTGKLTAAEGGEVGDSVAISASGATLLVGARFAHGGSGAADVFQSGSHAPTAVTGKAGPIGPTSAVLNASVDPNGENVTACTFEYGITVAYEKSVPCSTLPGSGEAPVEVSASIGELTTGHKYHYRISATNGTGTATGADVEFTPETEPLPTISKMSAKKGPASGGTFVTVTGTGFTPPLTVAFGSVQGISVKVNSSTSLTVVSPPNTSGNAAVTVTTIQGTSAATSKSTFKYENPIISSVAPAQGPLGGGTPVTIKGTGFALGSATTLLFKKAPGTAVNCSSTTECTVISPAQTKAAVVDIVAEIGKSKSKKIRPADAFRYE